jgi:hypothetical protein
MCVENWETFVDVRLVLIPEFDMENEREERESD